MSEHEEHSEGGSRIYRYDEGAREPRLSEGDPGLIDAISDHIARHLGPVRSVFHEIVSPYVHIDIHWVAATEDRPYHVLVTSGMSELAMTVPEGFEERAYAELLISLPADWPMDHAAWKDERNYWPIRWLTRLARFPHEYGTWLGWDHTMPNGDPAEPFAEGTELSGVIIQPPMWYPEEFFVLEHGGRSIHFWSVIPIYSEEMDLVLDQGPEPLMERFDEADLSDTILVDRPNLVTEPWR